MFGVVDCLCHFAIMPSLDAQPHPPDMCSKVLLRISAIPGALCTTHTEVVPIPTLTFYMFQSHWLATRITEN